MAPVASERPLASPDRDGNSRTEDQRALDDAPLQPNAPLRPVGMKRLKALREAIENGTYPTEEDILGGLERLFGVDEGE